MSDEYDARHMRLIEERDAALCEIDRLRLEVERHKAATVDAITRHKRDAAILETALDDRKHELQVLAHVVASGNASGLIEQITSLRARLAECEEARAMWEQEFKDTCESRLRFMTERDAARSENERLRGELARQLPWERLGEAELEQVRGKAERKAAEAIAQWLEAPCPCGYADCETKYAGLAKSVRDGDWRKATP